MQKNCFSSLNKCICVQLSCQFDHENKQQKKKWLKQIKYIVWGQEKVYIF